MRYSAPVIGGAAAARASSSSRGGGGGAARPASPSPSGVVHSAVTKSDPELPPVGEDRGQRGRDLAGAELEQPVAGPAFEGLAQPLAEVLGESGRVVRRVPGAAAREA